MSDETTSAAPEASISKSEFARRRNVTPGRVSQWIDKGKIKGDAIDGEGRSAKIVESIAVQQLGRTLDIHQRLGNGSRTHLNLVPTAEVISLERPQKPTASRQPPEVDEVGDQIRREQLESLQRKNRREAIEEAADSGRFTDAEAVQQEMGRLAARLVTGFEGSLAELAAAVASHFKLPQRDVLHVLRGAYRDARAKQAEAAKAAATALPETVDAEVATEPEPA